MIRLHLPQPPQPARGYDVWLGPGALGELPSLLPDVAPAARYAILADANVARLLAPRVRASLEAAGLTADLLEFPAGEAHKTRATWAELTDALLARGMGRDGCIIALGGGVTGDLAGFVAATYMRGIPVVQVPTTLVAMLDAAIGGKTGVDAPGGKNLVGAFHQPRAVLIDPEVLATLPDMELRSGLAEAVKHGAIADADYLRRTGEAAPRLLARDAAALVELVRRSLEIKADFVARDPLESGPRKALNFGHTLGHALEALSGYGLAHGYAVAAGMVAEAELGEAAGISQAGTAAALRHVLGALGLPGGWPTGFDPAVAVRQARLDKKARQARTRYTLLARPGAVARAADGDWSVPLEDAWVVQVLGRLRAGSA
ncbi:MAG: 3-dehydroquinate synthase [Gemmatimonadetes bacterium]|nr:3-dehydroquinate synthase [Gemmatimonadota bacterium]